MRRVSSPTFVGRAEELAALDAALARAADGHPSVLLIAGDSGVGKTRLAAEFAERARAAGARVLTGDCVELGEGELPYAPIVGALRDLLRELGADGLAELAGPGAPELARLLPGAGESTVSLPDEDLAQARLFEALLGLLARLGEPGPLLLVVEDLHWADRSSRDFLSFLARALRGERLVLVAGYRSDERHRRHPLRPFLAELERVERVQRLELRPFSRLELVAQLSGILGTHPEPAVVDTLFERSQGNAFFAEELLAAAEDGNRHMLPETLRDALMVRVEAVSEPTQEPLRVIAVAGRSVTHGLLAELAEAPEAELIHALREAVAHHVLVERRGADSYAFRYALMREAVYEDLVPGERRKLHVLLAEALARDPTLSADSVGPAAELAWHWHQAHELARALPASIDAAAQAERMHAPADAARHIGNAVELWEGVAEPERVTGTTLADLLRRAAELSYLAGEPERAVALARRAGDLIGDSDPVAAAVLRERLGRYLWTSGRDLEAADEYARAVEQMPSEPPSPERARVLASLAQVRMLNGHPHDSRELAKEAIAIAREVGDRAVEAHALNTLGVDIGTLGSRAEGVATLREALAIELEIGASDNLQRAHTNLADLLDQDGRLEEAIELALAAVRMATERGLTRGWASFQLIEAASRHARLGRLADADRLTRQALDYGAPGIQAGLVHETRGQLLLLMGRWDEAERNLLQAKKLLRRASGAMWIAPLYGGLVELAGRAGDGDEVRRLVSEARALMEGGEEYAFYARELYTAAARAEADAAERARARRDEPGEREARASGHAMASRVRELAEEAGSEGTPPPQVLVDLALATGEESRLDGNPSPELWRVARERAGAIGNVLAAAYAGMREAAALLESGGQRSEWRRTRWTTPFGLTAREREVLELVAAGRTNRQIGEQLFMSEKTASVHVSRILAKLEVSTRGEAGAVARTVGLDRA